MHSTIAPLRKSNLTLKTCSRYAISVDGEASVHVQCHGQEFNLPIIVTKGKRSSRHGERLVVKNQVRLASN